jgi:hypothetical protein
MEAQARGGSRAKAQACVYTIKKPRSEEAALD